jgi:hypothetical protein
LKFFSVCIRFAEAARKNHRRLDSRRARVLDDLRHGGRGRRDHRELGRSRQLREPGIGGLAEDRAVLRVDRVELAQPQGSDTGSKISENDIAERAGALARAPERDARRREQRLQIVLEHRLVSLIYLIPA